MLGSGGVVFFLIASLSLKVMVLDLSNEGVFESFDKNLILCHKSKTFCCCFVLTWAKPCKRLLITLKPNVTMQVNIAWI